MAVAVVRSCAANHVLEILGGSTKATGPVAEASNWQSTTSRKADGGCDDISRALVPTNSMLAPISIVHRRPRVRVTHDITKEVGMNTAGPKMLKVVITCLSHPYIRSTHVEIGPYVPHTRHCRHPSDENIASITQRDAVCETALRIVVHAEMGSAFSYL